MPWLQISCVAGREAAPALEAAFEQTGALSVTMVDAGDTPILEPAAGETPLWDRIRITAIYTQHTDPLPIAALLIAVPAGPAPDDIRTAVLEDRSWEQAWLDHFGPSRYGRRLWVCPAGRDPPDRNAVVVRIEPGLAFGTGTHATTRMCLEWLDGADLVGARVVDYGCGSGILAIAAARLGARSVAAVDHDPQALTATRHNAAANGVSAVVEVGPPTALPDASVDILLANILSGPLVALAPVLASALRPGARLVLSGILDQQRPAVTAAYRPWVGFEQPVSRDGWVCLPGIRRDEES